MSHHVLLAFARPKHPGALHAAVAQPKSLLASTFRRILSTNLPQVNYNYLSMQAWALL